MAGYGESMVMGSPISSPATPGTHGVQSPYLPPYLLGEPMPASPAQTPTRMFSGQSSSPPKPTSFSKNTSFASPFTPGGNGVRGGGQQGQQRVEVLSGRPKDKAGPPVTGLLETISSPVTTQDRWSDRSMTGDRLGHAGSFNCMTPTGPNTPGLSNSVFSPDTSHILSHSKRNPPSPAQVDPFYTQGDSIRPSDALNDTWVTIFGFPPGAKPFILQQFSQYGNIQQHIMASNGNWMHIQYQSPLSAKKALSKNGKVFNDSIMVGVTPCIDKRVMGCVGGSADDSRLSFSTPQRPAFNQSVCDRSLNTSLAPHNTSLRPLTAAYKAKNDQHEVLTQGGKSPGSNGILAKTMEYVFGW